MHMMNNALQKVPLSRRESLSENIYYFDFCSLHNHRRGLLSLFLALKNRRHFFSGTLIMCCARRIRMCVRSWGDLFSV